MNIDRSIIAITGAGGGLGAAMARRLAKRGARLALLDFRLDTLEALQAELALPEKDCLALQCDVSQEDPVDRVFADIADHFGGLDVLINNAGITRDALMLKFKDGELISRMSLEAWNAVIGVNLTGVFLCGRAAAEQMVRAGNGGLIINISSISRAGNMGQTNYSAAKAGVVAMTVAWAKEFVRYGIRVNSISPGFIGTELVMSMKPEALAKMTSMIPAGRVGEPDEIAHTVQYLVENDFVNGRDIEIDGGMRL
jgi:3-oxoacyl-[acyl-carrier protein] reductase